MEPPSPKHFKWSEPSIQIVKVLWAEVWRLIKCSSVASLEAIAYTQVMTLSAPMAEVCSDGREQRSTDHAIFYARVASAKQTENFKCQIGDLQDSDPNATTVYKDISRGINFNRPGLRALLSYRD